MVINKKNIDSIHNFLASCGTELIEIKEYRKTRSNRQNDLYWSIVEIAAKEFGYTKDEMHEVLREMFINPQIVEFEGMKFEVKKSTSLMTSQEFSDYLETIHIFCTSRGLNLPQFSDYNL